MARSMHLILRSATASRGDVVTMDQDPDRIREYDATLSGSIGVGGLSQIHVEVEVTHVSRTRLQELTERGLTVVIDEDRL